jgi:NADH-quinone oxidoreductase subunit A
MIGINEFLNVIIMLIVAAGIGVLALMVGAILGPKKPSRTKMMAYESGNDPIGTARERFPVHFYLVAMLFIIFDIETVFMLPWAAAFRQLSGMTGLLVAEMFLFILILAVGYVYVWKRGALEWD